MCGICGVIGFDSQQQGALAVGRMMRSMIHRGPDCEGLFAVSGAAFGMRRLSIIDLPGGNQPIWNEPGTLALIFNGEIYNFRELRKSLEALGHVFQTQSDTEVIVHAYETWGEDCVRHLRGMFSLAILEMPDGRAGRLRRVFLARDRLGIKPLYYAEHGGKFFFASEVRALLSSECLPRLLSRSALTNFLLFGSVGEPETLVDGIYSLPPGHCGFVSGETPGGSFAPTAYWSYREAFGMKYNLAHEAAPEARLREKLEESVHYHLEADVPLGIFLSSGIDSTALAAIASRQRSGIRTFTVNFSEREFSEAEVSRGAARRLGTEHSELLLSGDDMRVRLDEAIDAFDQPSMDGINTFFVSWAARQAGLKVALSGLGSDELFGGYDTFRFVPQVSRLVAFSRIFPATLRKATSALIKLFADRKLRPDASRKLAAALSTSSDLLHPYFYTRTLFPPQIAADMFRLDESTTTKSQWYQWLLQIAKEAASLDTFSSVSWLETRSYLVNTLLRDTDTMSMCHSLEVRVPFLDHPLVEWTLSLPASAKRGGARKALLVEALGDLLPPEIIMQRKRTFTLPWENWLRGPLRERIEASVSELSPSLSLVLNDGQVKNIWRDFLLGRTSWSRPWSLFVLNEWVKRNLDIVKQYSAQDEVRVANATA